MKRISALAALLLGIATPAFAVLPPWAQSGNPSNDKLLAMPEYGQAAMLSKATHYGCLGKKPFYMGTETEGANKGVSMWSITCDNGGQKYMIAIAPNATGTTRVISCGLLHGKPWTCYEKLKSTEIRKREPVIP